MVSITRDKLNNLLLINPTAYNYFYDWVLLRPRHIHVAIDFGDLLVEQHLYHNTSLQPRLKLTAKQKEDLIIEICLIRLADANIS